MELDVKFLEIWTRMVESKCDAEHRAERLQERVEQCRQFILELSYEDYNCREYPKYRYDFTGSHYGTMQKARDLLNSGLFTVEELTAFVDKKIAENGYPVYIPQEKGGE